VNKIRFIFTFLLTICLIFALNTRLANQPAFGKLLNPFTGFYNLAENKNQLHIPQDIELEQLEAPVQVYFDERRIPHIFAENDHDLYYVQGYIVASLRLWQMEFQVLAAEGRISEILGNDKKYIDFDINQRRKGLKFGALKKLEKINEDEFSSQLIASFTDGVNAYIDNLQNKDYPIEYQLMGYKPESWSAYKTALLLMNMSNVLTNTEYDVENTNFITKYGLEMYDSLFQLNFNEVEPVITNPKDGWPHAYQKDSLAPMHLPLINEDINDLGALSTKDDVQVGSNNWALSGEKTASGYPLLANDPHLKLTFPSVWIEMHLSTPEVNTYGVVFPGAPGIIIGFNEQIAWGVTNSSRDVKDWYEIEFKDENKDFYKWQNGWRATTKEIEEIKVKGAPSVYDTIIYTHLGPVVLENFKTQNGVKNLALQWMAHKESQEYIAFYKLNRAKNFEDYIDALRYYTCPGQNFVFAAVDGDIALRQQGLFPLLDKNEGLMIEDGSKREAWKNFIPFEDNPMMYNPERNFVSSANQHAVDTTYPYYTNGVYEHFRNRVINETLQNLESATVEDMKALQFNNYNLMAAESLPLFLNYLSKEKLDKKGREIFEILNDWDYYNNANSQASTYYQIFSEYYYTLLWDEFVEEEVPGGWDPYQWKDGWKAPNEFQTIRLLRDSINHPFIDLQNTDKVETNQDLIDLAFAKMQEKTSNLSTLNWGEYKNTYVEHVAMIPAFSSHINTGGNYKVVNATGKFHGPSWRMIIDFDGGKIKGLGVYPGGQSGNPGSKYYDNMLQEWADGNYHELVYSNNKQTYQNEKYQVVEFKTKQ